MARKTDQAKASAEAQAERNAEAQRLMDESRPTPTQEENDRAKLGTLDIDNKEDDGAPADETVVPAGTQTRTAEADGSASYKTRTSKAE